MMPRLKKYFKTLKEARKACKERMASGAYTEIYPCKVYKIGSRYFVGGHWEWLQAIS